MLKFLKYMQLIELNEEYLLEAVGQNTSGVLHELLVGHNLNGGKHMDKHPDINGDSPKEAHDKLKSSISKEDYDKIHERAKLAANHIKTLIDNKPIHKVQWTSKPGDLHKATGIEASQKQDASDIVVTTKDKSHPSGFKNNIVLKNIVKNMHIKLSTLPKPQLVNHIKNTVLAANKTPMQEKGHTHIRHTSYGDNSHSAINPAESHNHIFNTPEHISLEHKGTSVVFSHKGIPFARHRLKFESQSDPLSSVKGSGELIKKKQDIK